MTKPTIALSSGHVFVLENSIWKSLYKDGHTTTVEMSPHTFWILLRYNLSELSSMSTLACADASIPGEQCPALPVEGIIRGGLTSHSAEWQTLALARADEFDRKDLLEPEISQLVTAGKTQAIRHRAMKLRARLRRGAAASAPGDAVPTREEVRQRMLAVLGGSDESRKEVSDWAEKWVRLPDPHIEAVVWDAVTKLASADLRASGTTYLYTEEDFLAWLRDLGDS